VEVCRREAIKPKDLIFVPRGLFIKREIVEMKKKNEVLDNNIIDLRYEFEENRRREKLL